MTPTQPLGTRARFALRLLGLLAVLAGVIGMHGLANHGVTGMEAAGHPIVATAEATPETAAAVLSATQSVTPAMPSGMDMEMTGWCIAILMIGVGGLTLLLRGNGLRPAPWVVRLPTVEVLRAGRDPDPPSLQHLSVQRC